MNRNQITIWTFILMMTSLIVLFSVSIAIDQPVEFPDPNLELAVREMLVHYNKPIYRSQLLGFVELDLSNRGIRDIEGIQNFRNLEVLNLRRNKIDDVSPLESLNNLRILDLGYNRVVDLADANFDRLSSVPLIQLNLDHNTLETSETGQIRLSDLTLLGQFSSLVRLSLEDNHVADLSPLANVSQLEELNLVENRLATLAGSEMLTRLEKLNLRENQLIDISAISQLSSLRYLNLHSNSTLTDISPLKNLSNLETLIMRNVPIGDQIGILKNFTRLHRLNIRNCEAKDLSVLIALMEGGALQDDPGRGILAHLDILENDYQDDPEVLRGFRPFWDNIAMKYPYFINDTVLPPPEVSMEGGFYQAPFYLELFNDFDDGLIYYTLDGSIPTENSLIYSLPILIYDQRQKQGDRFTATVVRAKVFQKEGYDASPTVTHTYFVGQDSMDWFTLPVVALAIDPEYLFDTEIGIYENFRERGKKWERPVHVAFFDVNQELAFEKEAQVRIHGSATRGLSQKSLRFYAENNFGDVPYFAYEFFPDNVAKGSGETLIEFKTLLFRNSGNDNGFTFFKDAFIQRLVSHTDLDIQAYQPVNVFVNRTYWGIYNIRERMDEYYLENHYAINPDEVTVHKITINEDFYAQPPDANAFLTLRDFMTNHDMGDKTHYGYVQTQIDLENFIDNQIIYIYAANGDWLRNNVIFWKTNTDGFRPDAQPGHDGRWRWMVIDMDLGFRDPQTNLLSDAVGEIPGALLANALLENETFKVTFINRFADHLNTSFHPDRVVSEINEIEAMLEPDMGWHIERWKTMENSMDQWHENVEFLREFARVRPGFMREQIIEEFELKGTFKLKILTDPEGGFVRINTIDIVDDTPGVKDPAEWSGIYFLDVPITLSAIPKHGFEFAHWEGRPFDDKFAQTISLIPSGDMNITAVFIENPQK